MNSITSNNDTPSFVPPAILANNPRPLPQSKPWKDVYERRQDLKDKVCLGLLPKACYQIYSHLNFEAHWSEKKPRIVKNFAGLAEYLVYRGEFITGRRTIAKVTGLRLNQVQSALKILVREKYIEKIATVTGVATHYRFCGLWETKEEKNIREKLEKTRTRLSLTKEHPKTKINTSVSEDIKTSKKHLRDHTLLIEDKSSNSDNISKDFSNPITDCKSVEIQEDKSSNSIDELKLLEFSPTRKDILSFHGVETLIDEITFNRLFKKGKEANKALVSKLGDQYITYIIANALLDQEQGKVIVKEGLIINASKKSFRVEDYISFCKSSQNRLRKDHQEKKNAKLKEIRQEEEREGFAENQIDLAISLERENHEKAYIDKNYAYLMDKLSSRFTIKSFNKNMDKMLLRDLLKFDEKYIFEPQIKKESSNV